DDLTVQQSVAPSADEFDVQIEDATVQAGKGRTITMTVTNTDNQTLSDISAKLFADSPISTTDDEAFIAELQPGQSETITFSVRASGSALTKTYPLSMDFQYEESDGDTITSDTYKVPVEVTKPSNDGGGPPVLVVALVALVVIVAGAGYYRYR
ncbi:MAG: COG1361 S-layer family protein, partial [Haloarculaceae archaeon]